MKKILLCIMTLVILSCSSDDGDSTVENSNALSFTLDGVDYSLTDYSVMLNPTNSIYRVVEATFDEKKIMFSVKVGETNEIYEFVLVVDETYYLSYPDFGNQETSITKHTDSKMEGTFRVTLEDTWGEPMFTFTNGIINIDY